MGCFGDCCGKIAQFVLIVINLLVLLCGAAIMGVGIALRVVTDDSIGWLKDIVGAVLSWGLLAGAFYVMIGVGVFLVLVGFFGCCGACKRSRCMLIMYIIMVSCVLLLQIIGAIVAGVFLGYLDETIEEAMQKNVQNSYGDSSAVTTSWDNLQFELKCCGAVDYTDYRTSVYFTNTGNAVPKSCCTSAVRDDGSGIILDDAEWNTCKAAAQASQVENGVFFSKGCYSTWYEWITAHIDVLIGVMVGLGAIQILTIVFACCVIKKDDKYV